MTPHATDTFEIFLAAPPGLEPLLAEEARAAGFALPEIVPGGVTTTGGWPEVWRANLTLRGTSRVLARIGSFPVFHLAQLDKRAHKFPWGAILPPDQPIRLDVTTRKSKIYHAGAAAQRIERAITETLGAPVVQKADEAVLRVLVRIDDNRCTISLDTSGAPLHQRGHKEAVGKAPMRETLAALFLRACGYRGQEPVVDPMCGSGTFVLEAAEIAAGLMPGRSRAFAFEHFTGFDAAAWTALKAQTAPANGAPHHFGYDRDDGAIRNATANAARAGISDTCTFTRQAISDLTPPEGPPGLVIVNPPYGGRIGNKKTLYALYGSLGQTLRDRFAGWRVGLVTSEAGLAKATALPFTRPGPPIPHGGLKIQLWSTPPLK